MKKILHPLTLIIATVALALPAFIYNIALVPIFDLPENQFPKWIWILLYTSAIPFTALFIRWFLIPIGYWILNLFKK